MIHNSIDISESCLMVLKSKHRARSYSSLLLFLRIILVIFLISFKASEAKVSVFTFLSIQVLYFSLILWFRPYKQAKDNILEIINESLFTILLIILWIYHEKSKWTDTAENSYIGIIISNSCIIMLITLLDLSHSWFKKCTKKKTQTEARPYIASTHQPRQNIATSNIEMHNSSQISNNELNNPDAIYNRMAKRRRPTFTKVRVTRKLSNS